MRDSLHHNAMHSESVVLSKAEVAARLNCSKRQVDVLSRRYRNQASGFDGPIPSSPRFGLYRIELSSRMHRWDSRDLEEYLHNEQAERHGGGLLNWRKTNG